MKKKNTKSDKKGGSYREVSTIGINLVGKTLRPVRTKDYGPFKIRYPMKAYTLLKFGTANVNKQEFANNKRLRKLLPNSLKTNFAKVLGVRGHGSKSILVAERIKDFNGNQSKNLLETGRVGNEAFWNKLAEIEKFFLENHLPFFNLGADNILVQWIDSKNCRPVLIDFKRMSPRSLPFQPDLFLKSRVNKKLKRRFAKLRKNYQRT